MNAPMNTGQARVVDPILTTVARGYRHEMFCFQDLFPIVPVPQRGGRIITFGAEDFVKRNLQRAPGANRQRLNVGYEGDPYNCHQRALDGVVPREIMEEAEAVPGISLGMRASRTAMQSVSLQIEIAAAELATKDATYTAAHRITPSTKWDADNSKPAKNVRDAKELIRADVGVEPNLIIAGPEVSDALAENADVIDRIKHTRAPGDSGAEIDDDLLASYFGVAKYKTARARSGEPGAFKALWGKHAILAYVGVSSLDAAEAGMGEPSFGYTYRLRNYPTVEAPWFDRQCDSWLYPTTSEDTPVVAGKDAAVFFKAVVG